MQDPNIEDDMVQQMLGWLNRAMDLNGNFPEVHVPGGMNLTEQDYEFLRRLKIAIAVEKNARRLAN